MNKYREEFSEKAEIEFPDHFNNKEDLWDKILYQSNEAAVWYIEHLESKLEQVEKEKKEFVEEIKGLKFIINQPCDHCGC